jgi:hypothetical protein
LDERLIGFHLKLLEPMRGCFLLWREHRRLSTVLGSGALLERGEYRLGKWSVVIKTYSSPRKQPIDEV